MTDEDIKRSRAIIAEAPNVVIAGTTTMVVSGSGYAFAKAAVFASAAKTGWPEALDALETTRDRLAHAITENQAFNLKVTTEINEARRQRNEALARIAALEKVAAFATHSDAGESRETCRYISDRGPCTCGLDEARIEAGLSK